MKKHFLKILSAAGVLVICFTCYLKGHADGLYKSRVSHMSFDVSTLKKLEAGDVEWAKSDQALFLWSALNAEQKNSNLLQEWIEWQSVDTDDRYERYLPQAQAFVTKYKNTFSTAEQLKAEVDKILGIPVEIEIE